jgi:hypothetical protein
MSSEQPNTKRGGRIPSIFDLSNDERAILRQYDPLRRGIMSNGLRVILEAVNAHGLPGRGQNGISSSGKSGS